MIGMLRAAATGEWKGFRYLVRVWFALTTCLIVGALTVAPPSAAGQPFALIAAPAPGPARSAQPGTSPGDLYPSVSYAGASWSVVSSRLIPRSEASLSRPIVVVEAIVTNLTTDTERRVRHSDVAIVWPDGRRDHVDRFEQVDGYRSFSLEPGQEVAVTLVFKPQINADPEMQSMVLEIQEPGRVAASVPLLGPAPIPDFPIVGVVDNGPTITDDPDNLGRQLVIAPLSVSMGVDAGPYRASLGERLVEVEVSVQRSSSTDDAAYRDANFWRLETSTRSIAPIRVTRSADRSPSEDLLTVLFVLSADDVNESGELGLTVAAALSGETRYGISFR